MHTPVMTGHSPGCCDTRHCPCNKIFIIYSIKSDFPYVNSSGWNVDGEAFLTRPVAGPPSTTSPFPCPCSSPASRRPERLAENTGRPPVCPDPVENFIVISSVIVPILDDIVSQNYAVRHLRVYRAQDIDDIRRLLEILPVDSASGVDLRRAGVWMLLLGVLLKLMEVANV